MDIDNKVDMKFRNIKHYCYMLGFAFIFTLSYPSHAQEKLTNQDIKVLNQKADQGDLQAIQALIVIYGEGKQVTQDNKKALEYALKGTALGDLKSKYIAGMMYLHGVSGIQKDSVKAEKMLTELAEMGNVQAQVALGSYYLAGNLLPKNQVLGLKWTEAAAKQNDGLALNNLGWLYYKGTGVKQDYKMAVNYLEQGTKQNNALAYGNLATLYGRGHGVKQSDQKAFELLKKSAELGEASAKFNLALAYYQGTGTKVDQQKAYELMQEAAQAGVPQAIEALQNQASNQQGCREVQSVVKGKTYTAIECPIS